MDSTYCSCKPWQAAGEPRLAAAIPMDSAYCSCKPWQADEPWLAAAIPLDYHYCSCKLTRSAAVASSSSAGSGSAGGGDIGHGQERPAIRRSGVAVTRRVIPGGFRVCFLMCVECLCGVCGACACVCVCVFVVFVFVCACVCLCLCVFVCVCVCLGGGNRNDASAALNDLLVVNGPAGVAYERASPARDRNRRSALRMRHVRPQTVHCPAPSPAGLLATRPDQKRRLCAQPLPSKRPPASPSKRPQGNALKTPARKRPQGGGCRGTRVITSGFGHQPAYAPK